MFFSVLGLLSLAVAHRLGRQEHLVSVVDTIPNDPLFIEMPLDHFNSMNDKFFKNRYWINATYYEPGGPVFLFDSGEQNAEPLLPYYLQEHHGLSAVMRLAARYRGLAILWEHRYYGASLPFPVNKNTTMAQWKFLDTEQALEDVVYFANSFSKPSESHKNSSVPNDLSIHPSSTPWVFLGGSYPGVRAAMLRQRNPSVIFASWASSAPVQAQVDMSSYYKAAERSLTRNCSADWVAVTKSGLVFPAVVVVLKKVRFVDDSLKNGSAESKEQLKFRLLKARLSGPGGNTSAADHLTLQQANETSNLDAATILMDPLNFYQYYGFAESVLPFCNLLETRNFTTEPTESGIASSAGVSKALDAFLVAIGELDYDSIPGNADDPVQDMSWMRQYCSEYGFYQRGDPQNPLSIETSFLSLELFQQQCAETFPDLPASPQVQKVNKYGGWHMNPSNVLFTNGEFDPWRTMGLASIEPNSPGRQPTPAIPACNTSPNQTTFFGLTYKNMVHVTDMRVLLVPDEQHSGFKTVGFYSPVSQEQFYTGLGLFQLALDQWLPCFVKEDSGL
ncbi:Peptidase S28 [Mycena indigotica]|uniref:Peptidase S28 n=1 Tax=Mycena indigotica TaxID=2126181 RepID=A0A8H6SP26_9AGAR|nr:Peptidase S28 [Mycena indigotica]KAF7301782.1 Peptidase S28 [Mycena indigotica]